MTEYTLQAVGRVESPFEETDDETGASLRDHPATIVVFGAFEDGLTNFDERVGTGPDALLDVIFLLDGVDEADIDLSSPSSHGLTPAGVGGVFTRRTSKRPNRLGLTTVRVTGRDGRRLRVEGLDALDGSPVLDLKPHVDWGEHLD